jgi:hypothetical protein
VCIKLANGYIRVVGILQYVSQQGRFHRIGSLDREFVASAGKQIKHVLLRTFPFLLPTDKEKTT